MDKSTLRGRAADIATLTDRLASSLEASHSEEPTFEHGMPDTLRDEAPDTEATVTRLELLQQLDELRALLTEPRMLLTAEQRNPVLAVDAVVRLGIAENFPADGASVEALASKLNLDESLVRRLLAFCATHFIYHQKEPDVFIHTAASRLLSESDGMRSWMVLGVNEMLPATLKIGESLTKNPHSEEPEHSGWNIHNKTPLPVFKALAGMPERAMVFASAMKEHARQPGLSVRYLVSAFPFPASGESTIVDVGGSLGHVSQALVEANAGANCVVEDWPDVMQQGKLVTPASLADRITFKEHDFFQEQPVHGADFYLLRLILHDWSDKYAKMIIKALIPALKPGARIIINDRVVPEHGQASMLKEREAREMDLSMMALQNGKERSASDWTTLFGEIDARFSIERIRQLPRSTLAVIEVRWAG